MTAAPTELKPENLVYVQGFATPPNPKFRPVHAFVSAVKLILNKDDTRQVFEIITALSQGSGRRLFERFDGGLAGPGGGLVERGGLGLGLVVRLRAAAGGNLERKQQRQQGRAREAMRGGSHGSACSYEGQSS